MIIEEDGEDEAAMIAEFVKLSAAHPEVKAEEITEYIFKNLRDPGLRSIQAAMVWTRDLEIKERIRQAKRQGVDAANELTLEQWEAEVLAITRDVTMAANDKKAALEGYMNIASVKGWVRKAIDKTVTDNRQPFPQFVFAQYSDA